MWRAGQGLYQFAIEGRPKLRRYSRKRDEAFFAGRYEVVLYCELVSEPMIQHDARMVHIHPIVHLCHGQGRPFQRPFVHVQQP